MPFDLLQANQRALVNGRHANVHDRDCDRRPRRWRSEARTIPPPW